MDRRYELLGETIEILLKYQGRTAKSCGRDLSPIFGVSSPFAESWINFARKGYIYGTPGTPQNPKKQRERLCHFLRYLRISPEAEIIQGIKERDHNFVYPP
ncbi:hypothetical protein HQ489_01005, partial [Candidatus Woesearchaeota archaeon]|nr:hypothetical protein [Candidatus Woesearchaeota archaeon]